MSDQNTSPEKFVDSLFNMGPGFDEYQRFPDHESHQETVDPPSQHHYDNVGNQIEAFQGIVDNTGKQSIPYSLFHMGPGFDEYQSFPTEVHQEIVYDNNQTVSAQTFPGIDDNFQYQSIPNTTVYSADPQNLQGALDQEQLLNWPNQVSNNLGYVYPQVQGSTIGRVDALQVSQHMDVASVTTWTPFGSSSTQYHNLGHHGVSAQPGPSLNDNFPNQSIPNTLDFSVETVTPIGIITTEYLLQLYGKKKREEAAAILQVSVSTFKRICRDHGIPRWPHVTGGRRK